MRTRSPRPALLALSPAGGLGAAVFGPAASAAGSAIVPTWRPRAAPGPSRAVTESPLLTHR